MSVPEIEAAVAELEDLARRRHRPGPHVARRVLLALGGALREGLAGAQGWADRARVAGSAIGADWRSNVLSELTLACGEFAQCVDPRYLTLPSYDLDYTLGARRRLADRLRASAELGFELEEREARLLALADQVLATFEDRRRVVGGLPEAPTTGREPGAGLSHKERRN